MKKDMKALSLIARRRAKRELETLDADTEANCVRETCVKPTPDQEDDMMEKQRSEIERHVSETFKGGIENLEKSEDFKDSVRVLAPVSRSDIPAVAVGLGESVLGTILEKGLQGISPSLGYTHEQKYQYMFYQYVLSGYFLCKVKTMKSCPRELLASLLNVVAHEMDTSIAMAAKNLLHDILKEGGVVSISLESIPSLQQFLDYFKENGCQIEAFIDKEDTSQMINKPSSRVHTIALLLDCVKIICDFRIFHGSKISDAVETESGIQLLELVLCLRMDPEAYRIVSHLNGAAIGITNVFTKEIWRSKVLHSIGTGLATSFGIRSPKALRFRIVRDLPCGYRTLQENVPFARCLEIQQCAIMILIESALTTVQEEERKLKQKANDLVHPVNIEHFLLSQDWFMSPDRIVHAPAEEDTPMNHYIRSEILLKLCDALIWPYALTEMKFGASRMDQPISAEFLKQWNTCLTHLQRKIKSLNPEDVAVKVQANYLRYQYDSFLEEYVNSR